MRRLASIPLALLLLGAAFTSEASANWLSIERARARAVRAVEQDRGINLTRAPSCRRQSAHHVLCFIRYSDADLSCRGPVRVRLSHRLGRITRTYASGVDCISHWQPGAPLPPKPPPTPDPYF